MPESVVKISTSRNDWLEQQQTLVELYAVPEENTVVIDLLNEGISLQASGLLATIDKWVADTARDPATITVYSPNIFEKIPYKLIGRSHFFDKKNVDKYLVPPTLINQTGQLFAFFVGNHTPEREMIAQDIYKKYLPQVLISVMRNQFPNQIWPSHIWNLGSLDNFCVQDQYDNSAPDTNRSLLQFYDRFQIELVAETMTCGPGFFPTEKTVRPIVGCRPFMIFGCKHHLDYLRKKGFRTFSELWNEDYDELEGPDRWNAMKTVMEHVIEHGYDCNQAQEIVQYNYHHLGQIQIG